MKNVFSQFLNLRVFVFCSGGLIRMQVTKAELIKMIIG